MPVEHFKVRIMGTLGASEVWSCGIGYAATGEFVDPDPQVALAGWAGRIRDAPLNDVFPLVLKNLLSNQGKITKIRVEQYGADGKLVDAGEAAFATPLAGGGAVTMPPQTSVCITMNTDRPGRSFSGRIYWPSLANSIGSATLRMDDSTILGIATAGAQMVARIAALSPPLVPVEPVVVSQTKSLTTRIRTVRVGDVLDTQRRRRDAYQEAYRTVALL